jgi:hypothetical protein
MLAQGAELDEHGRLVAAEQQKDRAKLEMNAELIARDILEVFSAQEIELITESLRYTLHTFQSFEKDSVEPKHDPEDIRKRLLKLKRIFFEIESSAVKIESVRKPSMAEQEQ